jgi:quercetin dioxygenase-like cupin family protein
MRYFYDTFEEDTSQYISDTHDGSVTVEVITDMPPAKEFRIVRARFQAGAGAQPHSHEWEHAMYIMKGTAKTIIQGEEAMVTEGMLAFVPRNTVHSIQNVGEGDLVVFGVSGPPRTEAGYAQLKKK